jgi:hypothetical protein
VRELAPYKYRMQHPRESEVGNKPALAGQQAAILAP